jgi:DNA-binding NarL/FixJ family response regulator
VKLPAESGIAVVAHAWTIREASEQIDARVPEIVLVADRRDGLRGITVLAALRRKRQDTRWIVVAENDDLETRVACVEAGADALLTRTATPLEMRETLWLVASGANLLKGQAIDDPAMMQQLVQQVRQAPAGHRPVNRFDPNLSPCLLGVLDGVVQGWTNRRISAAEGIAEQTVKHHIANLKHRLGARDRIGLVRHAVRQGWARMEPVEESDDDERVDLSSVAVIVQACQRRPAMAHGITANISA